MYKELELYPAEQELSPDYITMTNRQMQLDMLKVSNFEYFAQKQAASALRSQSETLQPPSMHLRNGRCLDPPLSMTLTKFEHRKLDKLVGEKKKQVSHKDQQKRWRLGFVKTFLADEVAKINRRIEDTQLHRPVPPHEDILYEDFLLDDDTFGNRSNLDLGERQVP